MSWLRADNSVLWWLFGLGLVALIASLVGSVVWLVWVPADYFVRPPEPWRARSLPRLAWVLFKNLLGGVLVVAGVLMLFLPGQGILTILLGFVLLDFPGKRSLEIRLLRRPGMLAAINRIRSRFGKPALDVQEVKESPNAGQPGTG